MVLPLIHKTSTGFIYLSDGELTRDLRGENDGEGGGGGRAVFSGSRKKSRVHTPCTYTRGDKRERAVRSRATRRRRDYSRAGRSSRATTRARYPGLRLATTTAGDVGSSPPSGFHSRDSAGPRCFLSLATATFYGETRRRAARERETEPRATTGKREEEKHTRAHATRRPTERRKRDGVGDAAATTTDRDGDRDGDWRPRRRREPHCQRRASERAAACTRDRESQQQR